MWHLMRSIFTYFTTRENARERSARGSRYGDAGPIREGNRSWYAMTRRPIWHWLDPFQMFLVSIGYWIGSLPIPLVGWNVPWPGGQASVSFMRVEGSNRRNPSILPMYQCENYSQSFRFTARICRNERRQTKTFSLAFKEFGNPTSP